MENFLKNPGLQHIINTSLIFLEKNDIFSFRLVNQDCKNIFDDPIFSLKKLSQLKDVPKDLIENWKKIIQNLQDANNAEIGQMIVMELVKMFCTTDAKYPLELAYKLAETKSNPDLVIAILENADPKSYIEAPTPLTGNLRPIHIAACFGLVQAARTMILNYELRMKKSVNSQDEFNLAIENHPLRIQHYDTNIPMCLAAQNGHYNMVQELLGSSASPNCSIGGRTPIYQAAKSGHVEIVRLLMPSTDIPNAPDNIGRTPIYCAALEGHVEIIQLLMPSSDNPNAPQNDGATPIYCAAVNGYIEIVQLLVPTTDNPNTPDNNGLTPIHVAAYKGHIEVVRLLLETTKNPNSPAIHGWTPMWIAAQYGHQEIVNLLNSHNPSST